MIQLVVDPATGAKLRNAMEHLQLCDDSGRVLGHFIPALDPTLYEKYGPQISEEEICRREKLGGGRSLAAILADLEKRA